MCSVLNNLFSTLCAKNRIHTHTHTRRLLLMLWREEGAEQGHLKRGSTCNCSTERLLQFALGLQSAPRVLRFYSANAPQHLYCPKLSYSLSLFFLFKRQKYEYASDMYYPALLRNLLILWKETIFFKNSEKKINKIHSNIENEKLIPLWYFPITNVWSRACTTGTQL